jgi:hypothetical protein
MGLYIPSFSEVAEVSADRGQWSVAPELWKDLALWWPSQESRGNQFIDFSGFKRHGTLAGADAATLRVTDSVGPALDFYADTGCVVGPGASFLWGTECSLSFWMRRIGTGNVFACGCTTGFYRCGVAVWNGVFQFDFGYYAADRLLTDISGLTGWHFWTCTVSAKPAWMRLYLDGVLRASTEGSNTFANTTDPMVFGAANSAVGTPFDGRLANFIIHKRALTAPEANLLYRDPWAMGRQRRRVWPAAAAAAPPSGGGQLVAVGSTSASGSTSAEAHGMLSAAASLAASGFVELSGSGQLAAVATIAATAARVSQALGTVDAVASIVVSGQSAAAAFGTLNAIASTVAAGAATTRGFGGLDAVASAVAVGHAPLLAATGSGQLTAVAGLAAAGQRTSQGVAGLESVAVIVAAGQVLTVPSGSAELSAVSETAAVGATDHAGGGTLAAAAGISAAATRSAHGSGLLSALAELVAVGHSPAVTVPAGSASLRAVASLRARGSAPRRWPYRTAAGDVWHSGASNGQLTAAGSRAGDVWHTGAAKGEVV